MLVLVRFSDCLNQLALKKRGLLLLTLVMVLLSPHILYAQRYGFSGLVQLTYRNELAKTADSTTEQWSIEQKYNLKYKGYVYHPKLLEYSLSGTFIKESGKRNGDALSAKSKDYNIRLNFIKSTKYPFTLFAAKLTDRSFSPITEGSPVLTEQTIKSIGLEGAVYSRKLPTFKYRLWQDDRKVAGTGSTTDERTKNIKLSLRKSFKDVTANLDYIFINRLDRVNDETGDEHKVDFNLNARLSRTLRFTESSYYSTSTLTDFTEITSNSNLEYVPSDRFRGNLSAYYTHIEQPDGKGDFLTNYLNASYKVSNALTATANAMVFYNSGDFGNSTSESMAGALNYSKLIARETSFSASTSVGFGAEQREELEDRTTMNASVSSMLTKRFSRIKTSLSFGGSYYYYRSSLDGKTDRYDMSFRFLSNYIKRLTLKSEFSYLNEKTLSDKKDPDEQDETIKDEFQTDSSLAYSLPIGFRGTVSLNAGLSTTSGTTERRYYYSEANLRYLIMRSLSTRANLRYSHETIESANNLSGEAGIDYRFRMIFVRLSYEYYRERGKDADSERQTLFFEVSRPF